MYYDNFSSNPMLDWFMSSYLVVKLVNSRELLAFQQTSHFITKIKPLKITKVKF